MYTKEQRHQYYLDNKHRWKRNTDEKKERHNQLSKESYQRHKEARTVVHDQWASNNHPRVLYLQTKRSARYRGLEWDLTMEDFIIPDKCPYLEIQLTSTQGEGIVWSNASVDRIDNSKGYIKGNIQIVSRLANSMKQHATQDQLLTFARSILKMYSVPKLLQKGALLVPPKEDCCDVDPS